MTDREKKEIELCLNCRFAECVNCLGRTSHLATLTHSQRLEEVRRLSSLGYSDEQMGEELGLAPNTIYLMRKELGIPCLRERKRLSASRSA